MPNPYPSNFTQLLDVLPPGSVAMDLGSGDRAHVGLISLEWTEYPDNSLRGDCLNLPFRDSCADLILSQAVIEHVTNPQQAFDEMLRVLKPGGVLYVEIAFMQPIHQEPRHFFNVTPYGLEYLLRDWVVEWQGTTGTAREVLLWIERTYKVPRGRMRPDRRINPELYARASCGVSALARKPV